MWLEPKPAPSLAGPIAWPLGAIAATFLFASLLVLIAGASPFNVFWLVAKGAAGSQFAIAETLTRATPLIFTGLAVAVAFRAKLWNIGAEAQLYVGAVITVVLGTGAAAAAVGHSHSPRSLPSPMTAGALLLLGPAILKTRFGVDEVVTTLLLNFIVLLFVSMLLEGPLKDPMGLGWPQSPKVVSELMLPRLIQGKRLHFGFVMAIASALIVWFIMKKTAFGYEMRAVGHNPQAARFAGIPVNTRAGEDRAAFGRPRRACRLQRSRGPQGQPHARSVAGLWLHRHRRRHAGHAQSARRRRLGHLRRRRSSSAPTP